MSHLFPFRPGPPLSPFALYGWYCFHIFCVLVNFSVFNSSLQLSVFYELLGTRSNFRSAALVSRAVMTVSDSYSCVQYDLQKALLLWLFCFPCAFPPAGPDNNKDQTRERFATAFTHIQESGNFAASIVYIQDQWNEGNHSITSVQAFEQT